MSNELGAGNTNRAKNAMIVTLKLSIILALIIDLGLAFGHNIWANFFSNSSMIIKGFTSLTPFLIISITLDAMQGILSGSHHQISYLLYVHASISIVEVTLTRFLCRSGERMRVAALGRVR